MQHKGRFLYTGGIGKKEIPRILLQEPDKELYDSLLSRTTASDSPQLKGSVIGKAYRKISDMIETYVVEPRPERLNGLLDRVLNDVELVVIHAPSEKDAFRLFETLNDRGLALNAADLIKNKLFSRCAGDEALDDVIEAWGTLDRKRARSSRRQVGASNMCKNPICRSSDFSTHTAVANIHSLWDIVDFVLDLSAETASFDHLITAP